MTRSHQIIIACLTVVAIIVGFLAFQKSLPPVITKPLVQLQEAVNPPPPPASPPSLLTITTPKNDSHLTTATTVVTGKTIPDSFLMINDKQLTATSNGTFKLNIALERGANPILITAVTPTGDFSEDELIVYFTPDTEKSPEDSSESALVADLDQVQLQASLAEITPSTLEITASDANYLLTPKPSTKYLSRWGGRSTKASLVVGNEIALYGRFTNPEKTAITPDVIRNLSSRTGPRLLVATVNSVSPTSLEVQPLTKNSPPQTLVHTGATVLGPTGKTLPAESLRVTDKLIIWGTWSESLNTISPVTEIINLSVPI